MITITAYYLTGILTNQIHLMILNTTGIGMYIDQFQGGTVMTTTIQMVSVTRVCFILQHGI